MRPATPALRGTNVQAVERAFAVLEELKFANALGVRELAARTNMPTGTVHRLVQTLVSSGYVHQREDRRYVFGPRLLGLLSDAREVIAARATPLLRDLARELGGNTSLAVLAAKGVEIVATASPAETSTAGERMLPYGDTIGIALLSRLPDSQALRLLKESSFESDRSLEAKAALHQLARARARGLSIEAAPGRAHSVCASFPFGEHQPMAISVFGEVDDLTPTVEAQAKLRLGRTAALVADALRGIIVDAQDGPLPMRMID